MNKILSFLILGHFLSNQLFLYQTIENNCPNNISYFAFSLPIDEEKWFVPIRYDIMENLIDLKIRHKDKDELFIRFKIIKILNCDYKDINNSHLKYKVLTYDEKTNSYGKRESIIEFKFSDGKGKIHIQHPNFPIITSDATAINK
ncbi:hypothetical protein D1631_12240 [Chryseobacterium nematophagum]|uniref:Uncharacterized protein n=1 Tax=Chryseobacterium nematophagum TaxID=2305228 RepID=A0A3M7TKC9_9FLAO|nr:hypothetical protein [Chryseobacterium nematophagum]RNA62650.1 hypothetical protein D1631_12240 [Chryseobacterium nematophagum]